MPALLIYALTCLVAYLLGSIPFGYLLVRLFLKQDIRETGSGNIGATNVARSGKKGLAIATLLLDSMKGLAAVLLVRWARGALLGDGAPPAEELASLAALFAIAGHMFPVWLGFRGGKGVATGVGAFGALAPWAVVVSLALFIAVVAATRYVSLGSILAALAFPPLAILAFGFRPGTVGVVALLVAAALIVIRHKDNILRLLAGTESRFSSKQASPEEQAERRA